MRPRAKRGGMVKEIAATRSGARGFAASELSLRARFLRRAVHLLDYSTLPPSPLPLSSNALRHVKKHHARARSGPTLETATRCNFLSLERVRARAETGERRS